MSDDFEDYWKDIRPRQVPVTSADVLSALDGVLEALDVRIPSAPAGSPRSVNGSEKLALIREHLDLLKHATARFNEWCRRWGLNQLPHNPNYHAQLRDLARRFDPVGLDRQQLAQRVCQVEWLRVVTSDVLDAFFVRSGDRPPRYLAVPQSVWDAAEGRDGPDDWIVESAAKFRLCMGRRRLTTVLSMVQANIGGWLPFTIIVAWLLSSGQMRRYSRRIRDAVGRRKLDRPDAKAARRADGDQRPESIMRHVGGWYDLLSE